MDKDLSEARRVLEVEAKCLLAARDRLGAAFPGAVDLLVRAVKDGGKVVVSGVGKSGKIAAKVAATFASLGTPSIFLHAGEASHGDLGVVTGKDVALLFSYSGSSEEVTRLVPSLRARGAHIISVVGNTKSQLATQSDFTLDGAVETEACPLNLAPTSSTTVALALGDALAVVLSQRLDFKKEDFANNHPGGTLGRRLTLRVSDLMQKGSELPWLDEAAGMDEVVTESTVKKLGAVLIRSRNGDFAGIITDGDIRRALQHKQRFFNLKAADVMTRNPVSVGPDEKAIQALERMENRPSQISVLPVIDPKTNACVGLLRLHDLIGRL